MIDANRAICYSPHWNCNTICPSNITTTYSMKVSSTTCKIEYFSIILIHSKSICVRDIILKFYLQDMSFTRPNFKIRSYNISSIYSPRITCVIYDTPPVLTKTFKLPYNWIIYITLCTIYFIIIIK